MGDKDTLLTVREVAETLNIHRLTAYKLLKDNKIKSYRLCSNTLRIKQSDLFNYIDSCLN